MWSINVVLRLTEAAVEFLWSGGVGWWVGSGLQSHFRVVLGCVVVGVVTIYGNILDYTGVY